MFTDTKTHNKTTKKREKHYVKFLNWFIIKRFPYEFNQNELTLNENKKAHWCKSILHELSTLSYLVYILSNYFRSMRHFRERKTIKIR